MASRKEDDYLVALIIHAFTLAHAVVAGLLGPFAGATLTPMTTAMVIVIGFICGTRITIKSATNRAALLVGKITGVAGAEFLAGLIPGIGNLANAIASAIITELLGWAIYRMFVDGLDEDDEIDVEALFKKAERNRKRKKGLMESIRTTMDNMSYRDKAAYRKYMKIVRDKNASVERRKEALFNAKKLMEEYGLKV